MEFGCRSNLTGTFNVCPASVAFLTQSDRGRIINLSSTAGLRGSPMLSAYVASKFGVIGLTQCLALELTDRHITANVIAPSSTPTTDMGRSLVDEKLAGLGLDVGGVMRAYRQASISVGPCGSN